MGFRQQKLARLTIAAPAATFLAGLFWYIFPCYPNERAWQIKSFPGGKTTSLLSSILSLTSDGDNCTLRRGNYIIITALHIM